MHGSGDAIKRVVEAFERSNWTEIDVRVGDIRVHLVAGGAASAAPTEVPATPVGSTAISAAVGAPSIAPVPVALEVPPGAHLVTAPSPGILWRSPEPGAPPFADVGDQLESSTTVCILEVMKLMSHIKAGVEGQVVAVYGENGVAVEKGQPLFAIAPSRQMS